MHVYDMLLSMNFDDSAVPARLQLALDVDDLEASVRFYAALFGVEPAKRRPGYANFAIPSPPLKLVLFENPGKGGGINHLGIEMADSAAVTAERDRVSAAGLATVDGTGTTCCYATQDKFWIEGTPHGETWEVYAKLADAETMGHEPQRPDQAARS